MDQASNLRNIIKKRNQFPKSAQVITVTSGKGGVGKTNLAINLAIQLSKSGKKVIVLDADFGLANVEILLGIRPKYNLADLLFNGKSLNDIITIGLEGIGFISGGSGIYELMDMNKEQIIKLTKSLSELDKIADFIIIDTGAGINSSVTEFILASSQVLIVATPEPTSITDAYALLKTLNRNPEFSTMNTTIQLVANRVDDEKEGMEIYQKLSMVANKFLDIKIEYLGGIPQDKSVLKAVLKQAPYSIAFASSPASLAIKSLANQLARIEPEKENQKKGITYMLYHLFKSKTKNI